ncbi:DUF2138 family protein [Escherichia coli]
MSQLPKYFFFTIPFYHVLSEDFVFDHQNHADRLDI